jgi:hypothetical protein
MSANLRGCTYMYPSLRAGEYVWDKLGNDLERLIEEHYCADT